MTPTDPAKLPWLGRKLLWLDTPKHVTVIVWGLVVVCGALFLSDFIYHKHSHFEIENVFGFYGLYGFFMCAGLVIAAKAMRAVLKRGEDYYGAKSTEHEDYPEEQLDRIE